MKIPNDAVEKGQDRNLSTGPFLLAGNTRTHIIKTISIGRSQVESVVWTIPINGQDQKQVVESISIGKSEHQPIVRAVSINRPDHKELNQL